MDLEQLIREAEGKNFDTYFTSMNLHLLNMMTVSAMQSMVIVMHNPNPDPHTLNMNGDAVLGLARQLFKEWDESGFTNVAVEFAPNVFALDEMARSQLFSFEQEMLSPLGIPVEAWGRVWSAYRSKAHGFSEYLRIRGSDFRFQDSFKQLEDISRHNLYDLTELDVRGGYRIIGTGLWPITFRPLPEYDTTRGMKCGQPVILHYSPFKWGKALINFTAVLACAVNTTAIVPSGGVAVASILTGAAICAYQVGQEQ